MARTQQKLQEPVVPGLLEWAARRRDSCPCFTCNTCPCMHNITCKVTDRKYPKLKEVEDVPSEQVRGSMLTLLPSHVPNVKILVPVSCSSDLLCRRANGHLLQVLRCSVWTQLEGLAPGRPSCMVSVYFIPCSGVPAGRGRCVSWGILASVAES